MLKENSFLPNVQSSFGFFANCFLKVFSYRVNFPVLGSIIHLLLAQVIRMNAQKKKKHFFFFKYLIANKVVSGVSSPLFLKTAWKKEQIELLVALQRLIFCVLTHSHAFCISSSQNELLLTPLPCEMLLRIFKD